MGGIYIHIPFCKHKCLYCDFYTGGHRIANWELFVDCLIRELRWRINELNFLPDTLYIGGGTPSLIPPSEFSYLISSIKSITGIHSWKEFTLEVNPEDVSHDNLKIWKENGVNRISMGIQSLHDKELKGSGRYHNSITALKALKLLNEYFDNISVDVMFGLPFQNNETYTDTLNRLLDFSPSHISAYSLMLEEGTPMSLLVEKGKINLPDEKEWLKMFETTHNLLTQKGYLRYEISNYSLPGKKSMHNSFYWRGEPYLGLGPGAHSYDGEYLRKANPNDIKGYLKHFSSQIHEHFYLEENLSDDELCEEIIMTRLRTVKGLDLNEFSKQFGIRQSEILLQKASKYLISGQLKKESDFLFLSHDGFLIYNTIVSDLF